jgi:CRISPR-associated protein Csh2
MNDFLKKRHEILFIYDVKDANPNGDPIDENKPRIDEETGINIVTDVRLKRTIRDYLYDLIRKKDERLQNQDVFVREERDEEGFLYDAKTRAKQFLAKEGKYDEMRNYIKNDICKKCIDIRFFGGVIPLDLKITKGKKVGKEEEKEKSGAITLTGPVQFRFGRSLHRVNLNFIKGTGAFADKYDNKNKKLQYTFREEYVLPYSCVAFYGIANENTAMDTQMTDQDLDLMMEAIWNGTKNLISRSKFGQMPRFLLDIKYKDHNYHIGDIDKLMKLETAVEHEAIRDVTDYELNIHLLIEKFNFEKEKIDSIRWKIDDRIQTNPRVSADLFSSINNSQFKF